MTDCIFCKIIAGEIPGDVVYENEHVLAFLDIKPLNEGHTLVIPKKHIENIFEFDEATAKEFFAAVQKVAVAIKKGVGVSGVNINMNNGAVAGQLVFHAHMHIIPRQDSDGYLPWRRAEPFTIDFKTTAEKIKKEI